MTTIISKSGTGIPASDKLETAELAVDTSNGNLYTKLDDGSVVQLNDGADDVDLSDYVTEAPIDTKQYARQDGDWSEIVIPDGGTGSSVHIGDTPPADPQEGQQWMEVPASGDAVMWIYDGDKWLQQPGGKDGANGSNGADGKGFTGGSYDASTGIVTFTSDDGLGFVTDDLRGADGATYDDSWIQPALDGKANTGDSYTKAEADNAFEAKGTVVILTQAEYDALTPNANTVYFIK